MYNNINIFGNNMDKQKEIFEHFSDLWQLQLYIEFFLNSFNVSNAFKGISSFGETLAASYNENFIGSGSGGLGHDLKNFKTGMVIEVKTSCTFQSNKCKNKNCNFKFSKLISFCPNPNCMSNDFKVMKDSRFGINAKSLLKDYKNGVFEKLCLFHIFDEDLNKKKRTIKFIVNGFDISFNKHETDKITLNKRLEYFENQNFLSSKSDNCNFLPNSYDFYLLKPKQVCSFEVIINYGNLHIKNIISELKFNNSLRVPINLIEKLSWNDFISIKSYDKNSETISVEDFSSNFNFKKKKFNKERGEIKLVV